MTTEPDPPISELLATEIRDAIGRAERGESVDLGSFAQYADDAGTRMAIDPDGKLKPVSELSAEDKWWCDGEDCGEEDQPPHVHCMMHRHLVDLVTGKTVDPEPERSRD